MSSCCDQLDTPLAGKSELTVALAGNPNSGKTTIFNALTGLKQKVANYPGVTVEKKTGRCTLADGREIDIIDLPGTYSLVSRSPDEVVAMEVLRGIRAFTPAPDAVICVLDASNLQRNLYLLSQLIELGRPMVVALNMMDIAARRGLRISPERLQQQLGVPVVPVVGHKREGIDKLKAAIANAAVAPMPNWALPEEMKAELAVVARCIEEVVARDEGGRLKDEIEEGISSPSSSLVIPHPSAFSSGVAERLLVGDLASDIEPIARREPLTTILEDATDRLERMGIDPMQADIEAHYHWIENVSSLSLVPACEVLLDGSQRDTGFGPVLADASRAHGLEARHTGNRNVLAYQSKKLTFSEKLDHIFLHKIWGFVVFAFIMATIFISIFWLAQPIMDFLSDTVIGNAGKWVASKIGEGTLHDLVSDGIFPGVGAVIVFVPQIALLFMFLAILEDSGYLARAAFLMDRVLSKVGLAGKSFIPLLSSFACAIPGIMATRTIENRKERLATIFIAPFMSCSARLPVYALLIGTFFSEFSPAARGGLLLSLYGLGIIAAAGTAWLFKSTFLKGGSSSFILELPTYKLPQWTQVVRVVWTNTREFLLKAGTTIFCLSVLLWALTYWPRLPESQANWVRETAERTYWSEPLDTIRLEWTGERITNRTEWRGFNLKAIRLKPDEHVALDESNSILQKGAEKRIDQAIAAEQLRYSFAGRFGRTIEPVIKPLGFDWKIGVGLVGAFAAREVFVSTMAIVYSAGGDDEDTSNLQTAMTGDLTPEGKKVWSPLVAISLLAWFVLAMQCMSTLAIVKRETNGWRWPIFQLLYMNGLAYVVSLLIFQIGHAMGY